MTVAGWLSLALLAAVLVPLAYLYLLAAGAIRARARSATPAPRLRFAVAIPAHDEGPVIGRTVATLRALDYPADQFDVYVAADHCSDETATLARQAGAVCYERSEGARGGKGAALGWLFDRIWETGIDYDAVAVFDADTRVDTGFLRAVAARLGEGEQAVQGQHRISNPEDGWYPALAQALFVVNNRFNNQGRANLGLSAMNLGDSICLRSDLLRRIGWGEGLTEDYDLRVRLLEEGIHIAYEPAAIGWGEAPATWAIAVRQRERWLAGTYGSTRRHLGRLLRLALRRRDPALLDGVAQMVFPAFSTLTVIAAAALLVQAVLNLAFGPVFPSGLLLAWAAAIGLLMVYPFLGLALERAPRRAYAITLTGPVFIVWRTALAAWSRFGGRAVPWVRTPRRAGG